MCIRDRHQLELLHCEWLYIFARQISISSFVLRTQRAVQILDDMLAFANSVCLLALSRSGRHILALLICARLIAPCFGVFAVDAQRQPPRTYHYIRLLKSTETKVWKKKAFRLNNKEKKRENARRQVIIKEGVVRVGALRGQRGANGAR